jgi:hypothetical protein
MKKKLSLQTILIGIVAVLLVIILVVQLSGNKGQTRMEELKAEEEAKAEVISSTEPVVNTDDKGNEISGMQLEAVTWLKRGFGDEAEVIYIEEDKTFGILIDDEELLTSSSFVRKFVMPLIEYSEETLNTYGEGYIFYIADMSAFNSEIAVLITDGKVMIDNLK